MKKYSLYTILFGLLLFLALIFSLSIYLSADYQRQELIKTAIDEKIRFAKTISDTIFSQTWLFRAAYYPGVEEAFISQMSQFPDLVFLRVVDIGGYIRHSGSREEVGQTIEDPDIARAITKGETITKEAIYKEEKINLIIYPSPNENAILVGFSLKGIEEIIKRAITRNAVVGFGAMLFVLFISYFVFRSIIDPLKRITKSCEEVRKGNLEVKIDVKSKTEIGDLAVTFNEMIKELKKSHSALEEAKTTLEIKVQTRTKELKELTERQEEIIEERTKELQQRLAELEKFHRLAVGRELKMIELKKEIEKFKKK